MAMEEEKEGNTRNMSSKHTVICRVVTMCGTVIKNVGFVQLMEGNF